MFRYEKILDRNYLIKEYKDLNNLTEIDLSVYKKTSNDNEPWKKGMNDRIKTIDKSAFRGLNKLTRIGLDGNKITSIDKDTFRDLINLTHIWLNDNQIKSIHKDTFSAVNKCTRIYLVENDMVNALLEISLQRNPKDVNIFYFLRF